VGNIPYYITGALVKKFFSDKVQPTTLVFLIQKEVAERIAREEKKVFCTFSQGIRETKNILRLFLQERFRRHLKLTRQYF